MKNLNKKASIFLASILVLGLPVFSLASSTDLTKLPLGDNRVSTSAKVGYIFACQTKGEGGAGAQADGPWIHGTTWNLNEKISVTGSVSWPSAKFSNLLSSEKIGISNRSISSNSLPVGGTTGIFPISSSDAAYKYDKNPNSIKAQSIGEEISGSPSIAASPTCLNMGMIGVALNGVAIFNGLDAQNRDAVAHEVQDTCGGHPQQEGEYHYHGPSSCVPHSSENNALIGYALDGFGIYSGLDANGSEISTADLDECHGTTSVVPWEGKNVSMYHYVLTKDFPYTLGCFKGTPVKTSSGQGGAGNGGNGGGQMGGPGQGMGQSQSQSGQMMGGGQMGREAEQPVPLMFLLASTSSLTLGSKGTDVLNLQNFLIAGGYLSMSSTTSKGYFGSMTKNALKKFQKEKGINPTGFFGPLTRKFFGSMSGGANGSMMQGTTTVNMQNTPPQMYNGKGGMNGPQGGMQLGGTNSQNQGMMSQPPQPPQEALTACATKSANVSCSFTTPQGDTVSGTCQSPVGASLACVPSMMR